VRAANKDVLRGIDLMVNTREEIDALVAAVDKVRRVFG
jgi:hypothetical protein